MVETRGPWDQSMAPTAPVLLPSVPTLQYFIQVARGLSALHNMKILHRGGCVFRGGWGCPGGGLGMHG